MARRRLATTNPFEYPAPDPFMDMPGGCQVMRAEAEFCHQTCPSTFKGRNAHLKFTELESVTLSTEVYTSLFRVFDALGVLRTGPLFGTRLRGEGNLYPIPIVQNGSTAFLNQHGPFDISQEYLLGYSEAVRRFVPGFDWYGHWVIHPEGTFGTEQWRQEIIKEFRKRGLLRKGLVVVFYADLEAENTTPFCNFDSKAYTIKRGKVHELERASS